MKSSSFLQDDYRSFYILGGLAGGILESRDDNEDDGVQNLSNKLWFTWYMSFLLTWGTTS